MKYLNVREAIIIGRIEVSAVASADEVTGNGIAVRADIPARTLLTDHHDCSLGRGRAVGTIIQFEDTDDYSAEMLGKEIAFFPSAPAANAACQN
ncbi:hypothetical protein D3C80_1705210 [compost metagenome]